MEHGQLFIKAAIRQMMKPASWSRIPAVATAVLQVVDTDLPVWQLPRLGLALVRAMLTGFDSRTINRDMITPWVTDEGAQVLLPNWDAINPVLMEMFGQ
jgi:anionic cell wall polymer biosynthesis LytR-Cps2A-Psr (LCP) family protein